MEFFQIILCESFHLLIIFIIFYTVIIINRYIIQQLFDS